MDDKDSIREQRRRRAQRPRIPYRPLSPEAGEDLLRMLDDFATLRDEATSPIYEKDEES